MNTLLHLWQYLAEFFSESCFWQKLQRKSKHTFYVQYHFPENRAVYEIMWKKYTTAGHATGDNETWRTRFAFWVIRATDTLRMCKACCLFTATVVTRRTPMLCLYVHCFSYYIAFLVLNGKLFSVMLSLHKTSVKSMALLTCLYFYPNQEPRRAVLVARTAIYNRLEWQLSLFRCTLRLN
jgi:hypothetical protein